MLPTTNFFGTPITRLILGDNPITGHSYIPDITSGDEMMDYYTAQRCVDLLFEAQSVGINTFVPLGNDFELRVLRQFRNMGGQMNLIFQPYPAISLEVNLDMMMAAQPLAIYHQGTTTDFLTETGQVEKLKDNLKRIRDAGVPVGLGTHVPETILRAEEEDWGVDFYMACLYNARRQQRGQQSGFITGKSKQLVFYPEDKYEMFKVIQSVPKPFLVFKLLAGGQVFYNQDPKDYPAIVERELREAYAHMKPSDVGVIGVFQRDKNQIAENAAMVERILTQKG